MEIVLTEEQRYIQARKRMERIKGFYKHLTVYCFVVSILIFINLKFEPHFHWFWFSAIGWGIGLFIHGLNIFSFNCLSIGKNWEDRKIKEIMNVNKN